MSLFDDLMDFDSDVTRQMLGLPDGTQLLKPLNYADSPAALKSPHDNRVFYIVEFGNEDINRQIDDITGQNTDPTLVTREVKYVRNLIFRWQIYGDDGFEWADKIRIMLFDPTIQSLFAAQGISLITDVPQAIYVPEAKGQQWYKRYDISATFNQLVTFQTTVPAVSGTEIIFEDEKGVVSSCSVSVQSST